MVRKKIDNRIRILIENGVNLGHRTIFVVVGDKACDQVVILHHMLSKARVRARPTVLWCYKKEFSFSSKKHMKKLQKKIVHGKLNINQDNPFELFLTATSIRYCYYRDTHTILGNTFGMCVLQDFESLTPNLLARTIETVEGGGLILLILQTVTSLRQLFTMTMDVHRRYRTEAHQDVVGRFNERFILSLASCKRCILIDDHLNVLPVSSHILSVSAVAHQSADDRQSPEEQELKQLKESLEDTQPVGVLVNCCRTLDQAKALLKFVEAISEKTLRSTVSLTAARGRGKSAALGLAVAAAVAFSYSNIFVTSPSPENLRTLFEFVFKGFDAVEYQEHLDYEIVQSTNPEFRKAVVRVNIFRDHRQTIQYIHPSDSEKLGQAELVVIDEAAAIPLPLVKKILGPYLVFLSSTTNGYEGTGRSLSLKLLQQLRAQMLPVGVKADQSRSAKDTAAATGRILQEVALNESIRYSKDDVVEAWLNELLCLDATSVPAVMSGCPVPEACDLYYINRDTLFCYHKASEAFLQRIVALCVASHYKNTPDDLQLMSDAPAHHLFCLLGPVDPKKNILPEVLVVIQVCLEGELSKSSVEQGMSRGKRAAGDLVPWTVAQQFQDQDFPSLAGARIVRIATQSDYQGMGYGSRAIDLLQKYYEMKIPSIDEDLPTEVQNIKSVSEEEVGLLKEKIGPRKNLPPLLLKLSERPPESLDYLSVSYGLTAPLLKFWKKAGFVPVYIRQTSNDLTGEHSCIMLQKLTTTACTSSETVWLEAFWRDFRRRFISLLSFQFRSFSPALALSVLQNKNVKDTPSVIRRGELQVYLTDYDLKRIDMYSKNMVDYHLITDLLPALARLYFLKKMGDVHLSPLQAVIMTGLGLQHKIADELADILGLPTTQLLGLFNRTIRRMGLFLDSVIKSAIEQEAEVETEATRSPENEYAVPGDKKNVEDLKDKEQNDHSKLKIVTLSSYAIRGVESDWQKALESGSQKSLVSIKSSRKRALVSDSHQIDKPVKGKKKKHQKRKNV